MLHVDGRVLLPLQEQQLIAGPADRSQWGQRAFDISLVVLLSPVILIAAALIALAVYVDSPGPVVFRCRRIGRGGEPFEMLKFRKMHRDAAGAPLTAADDERFTPIGRFLSLTRLDELPQVVNVLRGEMRLVGPRPEDPGFVAEFAEQYREILSITPGLTGNAQLAFLDERALLGPHDDASAAYRQRVLPAKIAVDLDYARHRSLWGDAVIMARTAALPVTLLTRLARTHASAWRAWLPIALAAGLLIVTFALSSGNVV